MHYCQTGSLWKTDSCHLFGNDWSLGPDSSINSDQKQKLLSWSHTGSCLATQRVIAGLQQPARLS